VTPPQPILVLTNAGAAGASALAILASSACVLGAAYVAVIRYAERFSLVALVALAAAASAAAWFSPVLFSSDVYAYAAYGRMAWLGLNPYAHAAARGDPLLRDAAWQWGGAFPICVYGPLFVGVVALIVDLFSPLGTLAQLQAVRALATIATLACIPLVYAATPEARARRLAAAAALGANPVVLWCGVEGHNDALALAVVLAGFALARRSPAAGGAVTALGALIKLPAAAAAIALASVNPRARAGTAAGLAVAVVASIPLLVGVATQLAPHGRYAPQASLQAIAAPLGPLVAPIAASLVAGALLLHGLRLRKDGRYEGWICFGLAAWVLIPNPYPWYAVWLVALASPAPASRAGGVALALSFTSLLRYVPDAVAQPVGPSSVLLAGLATLPLLAMIPFRPGSLRSWYNERLA